MKKILAIALALVMGLTAVSSLALVDPGTAGTNNFIFDAFNVSTQFVVTTAAGPASILADESKPLSANQMIYLDIVLDYSSKRLTGVSSMQFNITSEDVSFATYFNGSEAVVHYKDAYDQVRPVLKSAISAVTNQIISWAAPAVKTDASANKVTIDVDTAEWARILNGPVNGQYDARYLMPNLPGTDITTNTGWAPYTTFHIGLAGLVRDGGTKTEGTVTAAMTISASSFGTNLQTLGITDWYSTATNLSNLNYIPGVTHSPMFRPIVFNGTTNVTEASAGGAIAGYTFAPAQAQWVDIYGDTGAMYRVFKITWPNHTSATNWPGATEYIVQKISFIAGSTTYFESWAVGFRNAGGTATTTGFNFGTTTNANARFSTLTFYNNMPATWTAAGATFGPNMAIASNLGYVRYTDGAPLNSYYQPILDYFGLSLAYNVAAADSMFAAKAGSATSKTATFTYFGTVIEEPDDDVDIPETGDGSASVMIVLGASAILAAAALAFVMKKARD